MKKSIRFLALILSVLLGLLPLCSCTKEPDEPAVPDESVTEQIPEDTDTEPESESEPETEAAPAVMEDPYKYVVIVGVDGAGTFFRDADTPRIDEIFANGAVSYDVLTSNPTISAQCWGSLMTGVTPEFHKLTNSVEDPYPVDSPYPTIYRVIHENMPDALLASIVNWKFINDSIVEDNLGVIKKRSSDKGTIDESLDLIKDGAPALLYIQFDDVDGMGHNKGYGPDSPDYLKQINRADKQIGRLYDGYVENGYIDDTLFIVTADHGGFGNNHGGDTDGEKYIMFAAAGKNVVKGSTIENMEIRDTASIVLYALGLSDKQPETWTSRVPSGLFEGVTAGERPVYELPAEPETEPADSAEDGEEAEDEVLAPIMHDSTETPAIGSGSSVVDILGTDNVAFYLPFDGDEKDAAGKLEPVAMNKVYYVDGFCGQGIRLDDGYISVKDFAVGTDSFAVAFWMKLDEISGDPAFFSNKRWSDGKRDGVCLGIKGTPYCFFNVGNGSSRDDLITGIPEETYTDGWFYVIYNVDRENNKVTTIVNFKYGTEWPMKEAFKDTSFDTALPFNIGQDGTGRYVNKLNGIIDEFTVVKGVISQEQIEALKTAYLG